MPVLSMAACSTRGRTFRGYFVLRFDGLLLQNRLLGSLLRFTETTD